MSYLKDWCPFFVCCHVPVYRWLLSAHHLASKDQPGLFQPFPSHRCSPSCFVPLHLSAKKQVGVLGAGDVPCSLKSSAVLNGASFRSRETGNRMRRGKVKQTSGNVMPNNLSILIYRLRVTLSSRDVSLFFSCRFQALELSGFFAAVVPTYCR